ncbi:MAG: hypothetical protein LBE91_06605 [Tannerella sp.]|jgi:hypothetical protein|nr:hypothetical protein [Tannerella sp.]
MLRQIITPSANSHTVMLPETYYGKKVMVTVFALDEKVENPKEVFAKAEEARAFFNSFRIDLSGFKFDREEANER